MPEQKKKKTITIPLTIPSLPAGITTNHILVTLLIVASFLLGSLWTRVQMLENGTGSNGVAVAGDTTGAVPPAAPAEDTSPREVELDDDPILGDSNAPVTIVEFSDYECPFCKRFYDDALVQIKKEYIDTGKVKLVFRDMPLSFHDPMATKEAIAASCARKQGDDAKYFEYHDEIFKRTTSNGNGLTDEDLNTIATDLGLDLGTFTSCLEDTSVKEEITEDVAYANTVGASATPTFFVGKSTDNGVITGTPVIGAMPFASFKTVIDQHLQ